MTRNDLENLNNDELRRMLKDERVLTNMDFQQLQAIIDDPTAPESERQAAQKQKDKMKAKYEQQSIQGMKWENGKLVSIERKKEA